MAYSATKKADGNYEIYQDGKRISTGSQSILSNYGLSPSQLSTIPVTPPVQPSSTPVVQPTPAYVPPTPTVAPTPVTQPAPASTYAGPSLTDYLSANGQPSDLNSRAALATKIGLVATPQAYIQMANSGTNGAINTQLLNILRLQNAGATQGQASNINTSLTSGNTTNGVPNDITKTLGVTPLTPGSPIPANGLGGSLDISSMLGASAGGISSGNSKIDALLAMTNTKTPEDNTYNDLKTKLTEMMSSLDGEGTDLNTALSANGVPEAQNALRQLNLDIAGKKGALDKFDAETTATGASIDNQAIPTGLIQGQTSAYQKQRDLTKMGMAADLSASVALAQAYQGNIELATQLAQQSVDMKYAPVLNKIKILQTQIAIAKDDMDAADSKRMNIISELLKMEEEKTNTQIHNESQILSTAAEAAANGAPLSVTNQMRQAPDIVSATTIGANYIKGKNESVPKAPVNTPTSPTIKLTDTQKNKGASQAGLSVADFTTLPSDVQNYYVNNAPSITAFNGMLKDIASGDLTADDAKANVDSSILSPTVKTYLKNIIDVKYPATQAASPSGIGNFFSNIWGTIKTGANDIINRF